MTALSVKSADRGFDPHQCSAEKYRSLIPVQFKEPLLKSSAENPFAVDSDSRGKWCRKYQTRRVGIVAGRRSSLAVVRFCGDCDECDYFSSTIVLGNVFCHVSKYQPGATFYVDVFDAEKDYEQRTMLKNRQDAVRSQGGNCGFISLCLPPWERLSDPACEQREPAVLFFSDTPRKTVVREPFLSEDPRIGSLAVNAEELTTILFGALAVPFQRIKAKASFRKKYGFSPDWRIPDSVSTRSTTWKGETRFGAFLRKPIQAAEDLAIADLSKDPEYAEALSQEIELSCAPNLSPDELDSRDFLRKFLSIPIPAMALKYLPDLFRSQHTWLYDHGLLLKDDEKRARYLDAAEYLHKEAARAQELLDYQAQELLDYQEEASCA